MRWGEIGVGCGAVGLKHVILHKGKGKFLFSGIYNPRIAQSALL